MNNQVNIQPSLIFIPDISGFTSFINEVEVDHSTHIIGELLEIIIESNILNLKVSEIEGDAVLFYRIGSAPSEEEILKQAEFMFLEFHRHLKLYERNRICQCGACSTTQNLSLKFVAHFGHVTLMNIKGHEKLFGPDVTLAHRLLKNSIPVKEYVLHTNLPPNSDKIYAAGTMEVRSGKDTFEGIGEIPYIYFSIGSLKSGLAELPEQNIIERYRNPVSVSQVIPASLETVHGVITDASLKPKWILGLKSVREETNKLGRIGAKHLCIMPAMSMEFEITSQNIKKDLIEYIEKTDSIKWISPLSTVYTMKRISVDKTELILNIHYKQSILSKLYLDFPLRLMITVLAKLSLLKLRRFIN